MEHYKETIELYFELKGTPESSQESYLRRIQAFLTYMEELEKPIDTMNEDDIQHYILYLKREKGLSAGTINNYISAIKFFYTLCFTERMEFQKSSKDEENIKLSCHSSKGRCTCPFNGTDNLKHQSHFNVDLRKWSSSQ